VITHVQFFSSDGRLFRSEFVDATTHRMDISGMEAGVYLLELNGAHGHTVQRVLVNR